MSRPPNKAMPHAAPQDDDEDDFEDTGFYEWDGDDDRSVMERVSDLARDNPKTALGAGVALIAGAIASLAWPFVKSKSASAPKRKPSSKRKGPSTRKSASAGNKPKASTTRKSKTASAGSTGRKKAASGKADTSRPSTTAAPERRTVKAKGSPTAGTAKPRKPRSDKGVKRTTTRAKPTAGETTTTE